MELPRRSIAFAFATMKTLLLTTIFFISVTACLAQSYAYDEVVRYSSIYDDADYADPRPALKQVVAEKAHTLRNTFNVSRVHYFDNGFSSATVYWKEGRALILWEPHSVGTDRRRELVWSRRFLRLDKDVVPTLGEVGGSSYLVTKKLGAASHYGLCAQRRKIHSL